VEKSGDSVGETLPKGRGERDSKAVRRKFRLRQGKRFKSIEETAKSSLGRTSATL